MRGDPIEAVRQGVKALLSELRGDPQALETAYLSVITFDSHARQIIPLTELMLFEEPELTATSGATALGEALRVLMDAIATEVRQSTPEQKGDWRPMVFILTDGSPTDTIEFEQSVQDIKRAKIATIIACAAGAKARTDKLREITDNVLMMNTLSAGDLAQYFAWVSSSVQLQSKKTGAQGESSLPPPPQGFVFV